MGRGKSRVRLGLMPPLSGVVGIYGAEIVRAAEIARDEINDAGGVLGRPLELMVEDDGSLPPSAVQAAERLVDTHRCTAIIGNLLSNARIAVAYRIAEPRKVPYLNFSFYEGGILSRYFFHLAALPNQQIERMIPAMKSRFGPRMFFAGNNYEWPRGSIDAAKRAIRAAGGQVVGEEYLPIGVNPADIEQLLDRVEAATPDVFVPYFAGLDQVQLLTRFSQRGLKQRIGVVMGHYDENMASHLPPGVREGYYSCNTYFMTVDTPENKALLARLARAPGVDGVWPAGNGIVTNFSEGAYLCTKAFAQAANEAGSLDPEALVDALENLRITGPQGAVEMDPVTHHARVNTFLTRCTREGTFEVVERFGALAPVIPERYRHMGTSARTTQDEGLRIAARILDYMSEGVNLVDVESGTVIYANPGSEHLFGVAQGGLIGRTLDSLLSGASGSAEAVAAEINQALYRHGVWQGDLQYQNAGGQQFWCAVSISAFTHAEHGEVWLVVQKDITRQKQAEAALERLNRELEQRVAERTQALADAQASLVRSERLATLGQLTATVSHELRNPLGIIQTSVYTVNKLVEAAGVDAAKPIARIQRNVERCTAIVEDMLEYTRVKSNHPEAVVLDQWVRETLEDFGGRSGVTLEVRLAAAGAWVAIDPERMRRAVTNLLDNAVQAMNPGGGRMIVSTANQGERVQLRIADTGSGIAPEVARQLFEPLFSTKSFGVGLGLPMVRSITEAHGGTIQLVNRDDAPGAVAVLDLPALKSKTS